LRTENELDSWITHLRRRTILTDIEADFEVTNEVLGTGSWGIVKICQTADCAKQLAVKVIEKATL
jgi:hypothetical protein